MKHYLARPLCSAESVCALYIQVDTELYDYAILLIIAQLV